MKLIGFLTQIILVAAIVFGFALIGTAYARETVVALATGGAPPDKRAEIEKLARHLLATVEPGESAVVLNGQTLTPIGTFTVPEGKAYENKRAKAKANAAFFRALKAFADGAETEGSTLIDLPGVLRYVGDYLPAQTDADLIVLGVPLSDNPKQPSLSMAGGAVPNDGHILASPSRSPFGTAGRSDRLKGYRVMIGMPDTGWKVHDLHLEAVLRWAALTVDQQGGELVVFSDPATVYRTASGNAAPLIVDPLVSSDKLEMIAFAPDNADLPVIYDREVTREAPSAQTARFAERVEVGIAWSNCDTCDLDVWAMPFDGAEPIYFGNPGTREGQLFKDFTRAPSLATAGYETIAFREPVDLGKLRLAVNFYGGEAGAGNVIGEVRIAIGDRTWAAPFRIDAPMGNASQGAEAAVLEGKAPNAHWVILDPLSIVGRR